MFQGHFEDVIITTKAKIKSQYKKLTQSEHGRKVNVC